MFQTRGDRGRVDQSIFAGLHAVPSDILIKYASVVMVMVMSFGIFRTMPVSVCPAGDRLYRAPPDPDRRRTRTPAAPHASALSDPGDRTGAIAELGERGTGEGGLPGTARSVPWNGADQREVRVHSVFGGLSRAGSKIHTNLNIKISPY